MSSSVQPNARVSGAWGSGGAFGATRQVTLTVPTMDCATCPVTTKVALLKVPGVTRAVVSYARRNAIVTFDDAKTNAASQWRRLVDSICRSCIYKEK